MTTLYANPYDTSKTGFYFHDLAEFDELYQKHLPTEEYEIDYIDGAEYELFNACGIGQANLEQWEQIESMDEYEQVQLYARLEQGYDLEDALESYQDVMAYEGTLKDYAEQYIDDTGALDNMPENLRYYFDYEAFARDLRLGGDMYELEFKGKTYAVDNNS